MPSPPPVRPERLFPLFAGVETLPGVGAHTARLLTRLAGPRVIDLIWHLPAGVVERPRLPSVAAAADRQLATLVVTVAGHFPPGQRGRPWRVLTHDASGPLDLVWFNPRGQSLKELLPIDATVAVSGRVERYRDRAQMVHPERIAPAEQAAALAGPEPVYPLTAGLAPGQLRRLIAAALQRLPDLPEWQEPVRLEVEGWPGFAAALQKAHAPTGPADLLPEAPARRRLAGDELLANQLALVLTRHRQRRDDGRAMPGDGRLRRPALAALPFALTAGQKAALRAIAADMAAPERMLRLLQGDVGSGKTVVALFALLQAVECGHQGALMAPTELLARQHAEGLAPILDRIGVAHGLLTGSLRGRAREALLEGLAEGRLAVVFGTHALAQPGVVFDDLGLVVVDEQHKFGVRDRLLLTAKGRAVDLLVMTATPIPRTLTLAAYGDMDVTRLTEKPPGRRPVDTRVVALDRLDEVIAAVGRRLEEGAQAYWVCPQVAESEEGDIAAAEARAAELALRFPAAGIGVIHGQLTAARREAVMARFHAGDLALLVATTVIEVGVNVPAATLMVVEHADRFGLAQLHQLRGRVGRGSQPGTCLLLYRRPLGEEAEARLRILRETEDGFRIAEEDLRLRGAGDLLGARQSGLPELRLADLLAHGELLAAARAEAEAVLAADPALTGPRGEPLRLLLALFEREASAAYLASG